MTLLSWWREIAIGLLLLALGIVYHWQTVTAHDRDILQEYKTRRIREDGARDMANLKNKERTDEEHSAARRRAGAVVVRVDGPGIKPGQSKELAGGGNETVACFDRGRLNQELAGVVERHAERLSRIAREGEGIAADYRACRAWALSLQ